MHSKFRERFRPSRSSQYPSLMYNSENLTSEESDYYGSHHGTNDASLRFLIIRHGERVDLTHGRGWTQRAFTYTGQYYPSDSNMPSTLPVRMNWLDYEIDTPLTANGLRQSYTVGNTLASYNVPIVACYTSPAIRSIQTADQILAGMGRKGYIPLRIELGLFECGSWYALAPINFMSDSELINGGFNIDTRYRSHVKNLQSTESEYEYYQRSKETMNRIVKTHKRTGGAVLIVGHAPSLEVLTRHLMNGYPRPEQLLDLAGRVDYCSMTIVDRGSSPNSWRFRYSLDDRINYQQQQLEQANNYLISSASLGYQPQAVSQFNYFV